MNIKRVKGFAKKWSPVPFLFFAVIFLAEHFGMDMKRAIVASVLVTLFVTIATVVVEILFLDDLENGYDNRFKEEA